MNYERMYNELSNEIARMKGTDEREQNVAKTSVVNLLNIVEDREKEIVAEENKVDSLPESKVEEESPQNSIRDFARKNRMVK